MPKTFWVPDVAEFNEKIDFQSTNLTPFYSQLKRHFRTKGLKVFDKET